MVSEIEYYQTRNDTHPLNSQDHSLLHRAEEGRTISTQGPRGEEVKCNANFHKPS